MRFAPQRALGLLLDSTDQRHRAPHKSRLNIVRFPTYDDGYYKSNTENQDSHIGRGHEKTHDTCNSGDDLCALPVLFHVGKEIVVLAAFVVNQC